MHTKPDIYQYLASLPEAEAAALLKELYGLKQPQAAEILNEFKSVDMVNKPTNPDNYHTGSLLG